MLEHLDVLFLKEPTDSSEGVLIRGYAQYRDYQDAINSAKAFLHSVVIVS